MTTPGDSSPSGVKRDKTKNETGVLISSEHNVKVVTLQWYTLDLGKQVINKSLISTLTCQGEKRLKD